jgi:hypothetical protein
MEKEKVFEDDIVIVYKCGCRESKLEGHDNELKHCKDHHNFIECDEWSRTCVCGAVEGE